MSVWYDVKLTAYGKTKESIAKLLNLNPDLVRTDNIDISFGGNYGPGLSVVSLIENNPELVFLVRCRIECSCTQYWITRFNAEKNVHEKVEIQDFGDYSYSINEKLLLEHIKVFPKLRNKSNWTDEELPGFHWDFILGGHDKISKILDKHEEYDTILRAGGALKEMRDDWEMDQVMMQDPHDD